MIAKTIQSFHLKPGYKIKKYTLNGETEIRSGTAFVLYDFGKMGYLYRESRFKTNGKLIDLPSESSPVIEYVILNQAKWEQSLRVLENDPNVWFKDRIILIKLHSPAGKVIRRIINAKEYYEAQNLLTAFRIALLILYPKLKVHKGIMIIIVSDCF